MFRKLISNLPFNPSLLDTVAFYTKRMKDEAALRRLGFLFVALAMVIQLFAVMAPPEPSFAASSNDLVWGGFRTAEEMAQTYDHGCDQQGRCDIQQIFRHFGISNSNQIRRGKMITITDNQDQFYTYGRSISSKGYLSQLTIGDTTIYQRQLSVWNVRSWKALEVVNDQGKIVWIIADCGNITTKEQQPPKLAIQKFASPSPGQAVRPGDRIHYTLIYSNKNAGGAFRFNVTDVLPRHLEFDSWGDFGAGRHQKGSSLAFFHGDSIELSNLGSTPLEYQVNFYARVAQNAPPGDICNVAEAHALGQPAAVSNKVCHKVVDCTNDGIDNNGNGLVDEPGDCDPVPLAASTVCNGLSFTLSNRIHADFTMEARGEHGGTIHGFQLDPGDGSPVQKIGGSYKKAHLVEKYRHTYPAEGPATYTATLTALTSDGDKTGPGCSKTITIEKEKTPNVIITKSVTNDTQDIENANNTKAKPGDTLTYTLTAQNFGDADMAAYTFPEDDITNILDYADLAGTTDATVQEVDGLTKLVWPESVVVPAGQSVQKQFSVKVKDKLPQTNIPPSDQEKYNCSISNTISGTNAADNTVVVSFDFMLCKPVETVIRSLPNTGPGTSMVIGFVATTVVAYFFARSRLLAKELEYIRTDFAHTGGI